MKEHHTQHFDGLHRFEHIMGMAIEIDARDVGFDNSFGDRVFDWFRRVDVVFSPYRPDSEVSLLNQSESQAQ